MSSPKSPAPPPSSRPSDTNPLEGESNPPALPDQQPPLPDEEPPLPTEPAPEPESTRVSNDKGKGRRAVILEDADEEDEDDLAVDQTKPSLRVTEDDKLEELEKEEWDPSAETSLVGQKAAVERRNADDDPTKGWQAVWAPAQGAYYFWNSRTNETTWTNPLVPSAQSGAPPLPSEPQPTSAWESPLPSDTNNSTLPPIDPALSHLLPAGSHPGNSSSNDTHYTTTAEFNARTGRFTPANYAYKVDHLAEANRARRQEAAYFDVNDWEQTNEEERKRKAEAEAGGAKKLTKKDVERFKAKRQEKKLRNQGWLR